MEQALDLIIGDLIQVRKGLEIDMCTGRGRGDDGWPSFLPTYRPTYLSTYLPIGANPANTGYPGQAIPYQPPGGGGVVVGGAQPYIPYGVAGGGMMPIVGGGGGGGGGGSHQLNGLQAGRGGGQSQSSPARPG